MTRNEIQRVGKGNATTYFTLWEREERPTLRDSMAENEDRSDYGIGLWKVMLVILGWMHDLNPATIS
jgi:hypothetical protein